MGARFNNGFTLFLLAIAGWGAQQPALRFDVASVKRYPADQFPRGGLKREITPTIVSLRKATLGNCFEWAFGKRIYGVIGPKWLNWPTDAAYEIIGKVSSPTPEAQLKLMMQTLLKERFQLSFHYETRNLPVYSLLVAKHGPKLRRSTGEGEAQIISTGPYAEKYQMSMAQFAEILESTFQPIHVIDETGLPGRFEFIIDLAPYIIDANTGKAVMDSIGRVDETGALIRALPQQLGLRLEKKVAPTEVLVIDHLEKNPTPN